MREGMGSRWIAVVVATLAFASAAAAQAGAAPTTVSLTFDDGYASHYTLARPILAAHGVRGPPL